MPTSSTERALISRKWIDALFARFGLLWPLAWADTIAATDLELLTREWQQGLQGLTGHEIDRGLKHCRANHRFPPSIAEFRAAARPGTPEQRAQQARLNAADGDFKLLPTETWEHKRKRGQRHIRAILAHLRDDVPLNQSEPPLTEQEANHG